MCSRGLTVLVAVAALAAGCADDGGGTSEEADEPVSIDAVPVAERAAPDGDPTVAGQAIAEFGSDLFSAVANNADDGTNLVVSPASVAIALAMMEPGTVEEAQTQVRELLRIDDPEAFHASMNALEQDLEARVAEDVGDEGDPGEVTMRIANAAYLQQGYPFAQAYLDAVGRHYGPVLHEVDFPPDPDAIAHQINDFVAEATEDHITDLIGDGVLLPETVLALVNALYLRASWTTSFEADDTEEDDFTRLDGSPVTVPLMHGTSGGSAAGDGWVAARKDLTGGLAAEFVLPDDGRFDEVAGDLPEVFEALSESAVGAALVVPRFETRFNVELTPALQALGLTAPYEEGHLLGIAPDETLKLDQALHETWLAVDEEGIEAAAATALLFTATGAPVGDPVPVILDRPFLFRLVDRQTGTALFVGRVMDPTA
jgi:serine protease inhibitor